jgi:acyl-lipid omega-6 desaturase (Delta-12 desaturase)
MSEPDASTSDIARVYATPSVGRAMFQFGNTLLMYVVSIYVMFMTLSVSYWLTLALSLVASVAYLRLFMIGHDCAHRSYLPKAWQNALVGNLVGVLTNTPLAYWGSQHMSHHRTTGNLDQRGAGDVETMTIEEYENASSTERRWYRMHRNPWILMFVFAPIHFVIMQRWPLEQKSPTFKIWRSVLGTNLGILIYYGLMIWLVGLVPFLLVYVPVVMLSATAAVWLFYIQHQFENAFWAREDEWTYKEATLQGSSFFDVPRWVHWASGNIGYHHLHHLNPRIPNYNLPACYASTPAFHNANSLTFWQSFGTARLALWDEQARRLITFREYRQRGSSSPA